MLCIFVDLVATQGVLRVVAQVARGGMAFRARKVDDDHCVRVDLWKVHVSLWTLWQHKGC